LESDTSQRLQQSFVGTAH